MRTHSRRATDDILFLMQSAHGQLITNQLRRGELGSRNPIRHLRWLLELRKYLIFTILCQLTYANFSLSSPWNLFDVSTFFSAAAAVDNFFLEFLLSCRTAEIIKITPRLKQSGESKSLLNSFHGAPREQKKICRSLPIEFKLINSVRTAARVRLIWCASRC